MEVICSSMSLQTRSGGWNLQLGNVENFEPIQSKNFNEVLNNMNGLLVG
jgi:hypothetical protein